MRQTHKQLVIVCDRCGAEESERFAPYADVGEAYTEYFVETKGWATVSVCSGSDTVEYEVCPDCGKDLDDRIRGCQLQKVSIRDED